MCFKKCCCSKTHNETKSVVYFRLNLLWHGTFIIKKTYGTFIRPQTYSSDGTPAIIARFVKILALKSACRRRQVKSKKNGTVMNIYIYV